MVIEGQHFYLISIHEYLYKNVTLKKVSKLLHRFRAKYLAFKDWKYFIFLKFTKKADNTMVKKIFIFLHFA